MTTAQSKSEALARYFRASSGNPQSINGQYDRYLSSQPFSSCFQTLVGVRQAEPLSLPRSLDTIAQRLGHISTGIPMIDVQRDALSGVLLSQEGDVIVVNGSPGSGKTTLLQSAVAVMFTRAALDKKPAPILIGLSAKQSLVNDLAISFTIPAAPPGGAVAATAAAPVYLELNRPGFTTRWLPAGNKIGFGLHMAVQSSSLLDLFLTEQSLIELAHGPGLQLSRRHFLRAFNTAFPSLSDGQLTLAEVQEKLHEQLATIDQQLKNIQEAAINIQGSFPDLLSDKNYQGKKARELSAAETIYNTLSAAHQHWQKKTGENFLWKTASSLFGSNRQKQAEVISLYLADLRGIPQATLEALEQASKPCIAEGDWKGFTAILQQESADALSRVRILEGQTEAIENLLSTWAEITQLIGGAPGQMSINQCDQLLDSTLRAQAFWLAVHIFEARWIQAMADSQWSSAPQNAGHANTPEGVRHKLRLYSMLTPCLVTSLERLPSQFLAADGADGQSQTLWNEIDLLIVDEAAQIAPEYAGHFALAKRALVSGDVCQTLPAWSVSEQDDRDYVAQILPGRAWDDIHELGGTLSGGSIMHMARSATPFEPDPDLGPGLYLSHHKRSVDSIIQYCNKLCYQGKLVSLRPDSEVDRDALGLPAMGWTHIHGVSEHTEQGWRNLPEARSVAAWINHHQAALQKHYHLIIGRVVAVVAPYQAQVDAIRAELSALDIKDLVVGTPRDLAGINRPVVLFSSVYTWCNTLPYVFDQGPGFLNVAVSRAADSFLVFGDRGVFNTAADTPSGLLIRYMKSLPDSEIDSNPEWATRPELVVENATGSHAVLSTPEQHKLALQQAFEQARSRIIMISPWFGQASPLAETIPVLAAAARGRGVNCMVFISLASPDAQTAPAFQRYYKALTDVGVTVELIGSVYSQLMFVDGTHMYVGASHWISPEPAVKFQRKQATVHYQSPKVAQELAMVVKGLVAHRQAPVVAS